MRQASDEIKREKVYLRKARLQGFRTIQDTEIDFDPGLNIIIGKNGVGKSNFLKFLQSSIIFAVGKLSSPLIYLLFSKDETDTLSIEISKRFETIVRNGAPTVETTPTSFEISRGETPPYRTDQTEEVYDYLDKNEFIFSTVFIAHGIPLDYFLVDSPFSFKIDRKGFIVEYPEIISNIKRVYFLKSIVHLIFIKSIRLFMEKKAPNRKDVKAILLETFEVLELIESVLETFSDIKGLRINENYNIMFDRRRKEFSVQNLFLEFKVDGQWLPFSHLSDGTKRMFYVISETTFPGFFQYQHTRFALDPREASKIVLIEEPELGLHPERLDSLMHFLKESSEEHQIIVTTHAPQLLDILGKKELNKIIIARLSKDGTKLRHLSKKEQEKAGLYMEEEAYLSDYWRYSDLES